MRRVGSGGVAGGGGGGGRKAIGVRAVAIAAWAIDVPRGDIGLGHGNHVAGAIEGIGPKSCGMGVRERCSAVSISMARFRCERGSYL